MLDAAYTRFHNNFVQCGSIRRGFEQILEDANDNKDDDLAKETKASEVTVTGVKTRKIAWKEAMQARHENSLHNLHTVRLKRSQEVVHLAHTLFNRIPWKHWDHLMPQRLATYLCLIHVQALVTQNAATSTPQTVCVTVASPQITNGPIGVIVAHARSFESCKTFHS